MPDYAIYGKIHIDQIVQVSRTTLYLGGGGPQGAYGARLWSDSVGFLTRSGTDMAPEFVAQIEAMGLDLAGWKKFDDLPTPLVVLEYDENEYLTRAGIEDRASWTKMMRTPIPLPDSYQSVRAIHLITEWADAAMVQSALELRERGAIFSLEPIIDWEKWTNREAILNLLPSVDLVTPDWPSASGIAGADDPKVVLKHWTTLGTRLVAIRHGGHGAYVWSRDEDRLWHVPPAPVNQVIDPTGAGNAFGGGLVVGWTETGDARTAGCYGAIAASLLLEVPGIPAIDAALQARARAMLQPALNAVREL